MKPKDFVKVWLPVDHRMMGQDEQAAPFFVLGEKYASAIHQVSKAMPITAPLASALDIEALLAWVDGVMLTGSPANVHARHYGREVADPELPLDEKRDALTLPLVKACIENGVPLLGVCRGLQEINVALGGSLHQGVQNQPGYLDHREDKSRPFAEQYDTAHVVRLKEGSRLRAWAGTSSAWVNSLHGQGIDALAPGLTAVAHAEDGLIEAVEFEQAKSFALAVQWHPEWRPLENPFYASIFEAFGQACRQRNQQRHGA